MDRSPLALCSDGKHILNRKNNKVSKWGQLKVWLSGEREADVGRKWWLLNAQPPTVTIQITFTRGQLYLSEKLKKKGLVPDATECFYQDDFLSL